MVERSDQNKRLAVKLGLIVVAMVVLSFASVPLYRIFCQATGFGGTTRRVDAAPASSAAAPNRLITVSFNVDTAQDLAWEFRGPEVRQVKVPIGEAATVMFSAKNLSNQALVGTAVHNVQPDKVGVYFNKTECFCFTEQILQPGAVAEFPVTFFFDPAMADDRSVAEVENVTLSYTFFLAKDQSKARMDPSRTTTPTRSN